MKPTGAMMKKQPKHVIEAEVEQLRGIALALYRCLEKTAETPASKRAMDDFIKYIMEKV
jgi:hypothetical protein